MIRVLVVEDEPLTGAAHAEYVGRCDGFEVVGIARTGRAADAFDRAVLAAVDELHDGSRITAPTWAALGAHLDEQQRMDLLFTAGGYGVLATALNTFGVEPEDWAGDPANYSTAE